MYLLGRRSRGELVGVHPDLVSVVELAITTTRVDFAVHDGLRSMQEQEEYVLRGVSRTLKSKHLEQDDGYGHAVDLVPYINGKLRWEWVPIYEIARAMHEAAEDRDVDLRWGGVWDRKLRDLDSTDLESEVQGYVERRKRRGLRAFLDGPHFEIITDV